MPGPVSWRAPQRGTGINPGHDAPRPNFLTVGADR